MLTDNDITYSWNKDNPDERGSALAFIIDEDVVYDAEYFGSILLSNPTIKDLNAYPYGRYVIAPNAKFVNNEFVVLDMSTEGLPPFITDEEIAQRQAAYDAAQNA